MASQLNVSVGTVECLGMGTPKKTSIRHAHRSTDEVQKIPAWTPTVCREKGGGVPTPTDGGARGRRGE